MPKKQEQSQESKNLQPQDAGGKEDPMDALIASLGRVNLIGKAKNAGIKKKIIVRSVVPSSRLQSRQSVLAQQKAREQATARYRAEQSALEKQLKAQKSAIRLAHKEAITHEKALARAQQEGISVSEAKRRNKQDSEEKKRVALEEVQRIIAENKARKAQRLAELAQEMDTEAGPSELVPVPQSTFEMDVVEPLIMRRTVASERNRRIAQQKAEKERLEKEAKKRIEERRAMRKEVQQEMDPLTAMLTGMKMGGKKKASRKEKQESK